MHWYGGSIAEAVSLSKQKNAIFVVFVEGDNEQSAEMAATIDETGVLKRLSDENNFLAIKLKSGSANYTNFARIYQFVPVPSLFFIGRNGIPLEVVCAGVEPNNLATRIDRILEEHHKGSPSSVQPSTSSQNVKEQTVNLLQAESTNVSADTQSNKRPPPDDLEPETSSGPPLKKHHEITKSGQEYDVVCDGDVCVRIPKAKADLDAGTSQASASAAPQEPTQEPSPAAAVDSAADIEDKLERAKELIEARRREKEEKEKEEARQKELERRAAGQGVAELKRWQADQELKQIQEERRREKMENNLARQRILEQIAQDRAERRAREVPQPAPPQHQLPTSSSSGDGSGQARIQLKLPDGGVHTAHFDADASIADLRQYVADTLHMSPSSFTLWTAFPRREVTRAEGTLRALQLAPSAALLVLPARSQAIVAPSRLAAAIAFFSQFLTSFILEPSQQVYNWVMSRLFPAPARGNSPPRAPGNNPAPGNVPGLRRRGNIHRLTEDRPKDDDNNTWNGNSTQQM